MNKDIRWEQRFSNYNKALSQLEKAVLLSKERELSDLEEQGLIKSFEFTHELACQVMQDFFKDQGNMNIKGSKDSIKEAFNKGFIEDGEGWMETIVSRNKTVHTYNEETADEIAENIIHRYFELFTAFRDKMEEYRSGKQGKLL